MIVILKDNPDQKQLDNLISWLKSMNLDIHRSEGSSTTILGLIGDTASVDIDLIKALDIVETVKRVQEPYKNANRKFHPEDTVVDMSSLATRSGGGDFQVIAGPDVPSNPKSRSARSHKRSRLQAQVMLQRRSVQAEDFAIRIPGYERRR